MIGHPRGQADGPGAFAPRPAALEHVQVLDLSSGVAGQYCGKLMAGYGAHVTLAEPSEGTGTRSMPPFADSPGRESLLFRHLNQGKVSISLPDRETEQRQMVATLVGEVDVVIRDADTWVPSLSDDVIDCVVSDFPQTGPYADWQADEMVHQELSGYMNATGRSDRRPLYGVGRRAYYACGTTAYVSALAALYERRTSGRGQRVCASVFESVAAIGQNFVTQNSYNGTTESRARYTGLLATLECRDGYIVMFAIRDPAAVCRTFDAEHLADDPRFAQPASLIRNWDELVKVFQDRAREMTTDEVVLRAQTERISCERVLTLGELVASAQWRGRGMIRSLASMDSAVLANAPGITEKALGPVFRISGSPYRADTPSPRLAPMTEPETEGSR